MKRKNTRNSLAAAAFLLASGISIAALSVNAKKQMLPDGIFSGKSEGRNGTIAVSFSVENGKITAAKVTEEQETDYAKAAINSILEQFSAEGKTDGIDIVSGATITSKATISALKNAVNSARGKKSAQNAQPVSDTSCDILVIGAGGAGLSAAAEAASKGASVIVLEKEGNVGGNTIAATGGLNASETSVQKKLGIQDTNEQFFEDTMKGGHYKNDPSLVRNLTEKSAETVDWLISLGADLTDVGKMAGSTNRRTHRPQGGSAVGSNIIPVLEKAALASGAEIRCSSKVIDLLSKDGRPTGAVVQTDSGEYIVNAKSIIIATGGFGANPKMVSSYKPEFEGFGTTNHKGATGDAFSWVQKFNVQLTQMDEIQTHPTVVPGNGTMITEAVRGNGAILVNRSGKRFCTEMATRDEMSKAILSQKGGTAFLVFDQEVRGSLKAIETYIKNGLITQGETAAELAEKLEIPADEFEKTLSEYASIQKSGKDPLGRKPTEMPCALENPPYYAVEVGPAVHHTMGGLTINTKAQVIDNEGNPVPGLFAAGEVTGGIHGSNRLGGNAVADICIYGKIAAESALEEITEK
ncbi:flavocytochrome c [Treponema sp.]|uniref:flavocytochrome c n=1 Tax=Treponema sp. TaxID=166 RepID=UPI003F11BB3B